MFDHLQIIYRSPQNELYLSGAPYGGDDENGDDKNEYRHNERGDVAGDDEDGDDKNEYRHKERGGLRAINILALHSYSPLLEITIGLDLLEDFLFILI